VDLSCLSHAEKDALIISQQARIAALEATVLTLEIRLAELEAKLAADSTKSNRPPSSDGLKKGPPKPRSLRLRSGKKPGGQPDHPGTTLAFSENPDQIVVHALPPLCDACNEPLPESTAFTARQVFDLPEIRFTVTEHRVMEVQCLCGKAHRGEFPVGVNAPVQYGPNVTAVAVYLTQHQMLPVQRTSDLITDMFGLSFSAASVQQAIVDAAERLAPTVDAIADALRKAPVVHADETGMRVESKLHWMHTAATPLFTWLGCHKKRGTEAMNEHGILPHFRGTLVHDGLKWYRSFEDCLHSLCNQHHLRELKALVEDHQQQWAEHLGMLLQEACHEVNVSENGCLTPERIEDYRARYDALLCTGERENPARAPSGKRGRTKQSTATNLLGRLRTHADDVWRFAGDPEVPFTNNIAEQAVRMPKVKQKISGGFRTKQGVERFCVIRSYLETMRKQGHHLVTTLTQAIRGVVPQPHLA
jgi:transposase